MSQTPSYFSENAAIATAPAMPQSGFSALVKKGKGLVENRWKVTRNAAWVIFGLSIILAGIMIGLIWTETKSWQDDLQTFETKHDVHVIPHSSALGGTYGKLVAIIVAFVGCLVSILLLSANPVKIRS